MAKEGTKNDSFLKNPVYSGLTMISTELFFQKKSQTNSAGNIAKQTIHKRYESAAEIGPLAKCKT